jgi:hypothetical protein
MNLDYFFVAGIIVCILALPALMGVFFDQRPPRVTIMTLLIAGLLIVYPITQDPETYTLEAIPDIFARVVRDFL